MGSTILSRTHWIVTLFMVAGMASVVLAFPCDRFGWYNDCDEVMDSSLSWDEKMETVASMIDDDYSWNTDFSVDEPPEGVGETDEGMVKDAWVEIFAVMPSVYEDGDFLSPGYGDVIAKSNYDVEKPDKKYRKDCKTKYYLDHWSRIEYYLNNDYIGSGNSEGFNTEDSELKFRAELVVTTELITKHYRWQKVDKKWKCRYYDKDVEEKTETVATDTFTLKRHQPPISYIFKIQNKYYGINQIKFQAFNYSWFRVQFNDNSYYEEVNHEFGRFFTYDPYYILNYYPYEKKTVSYGGIRFQNDTFQVTDLNGCTIYLGDYFRTYEIPCPTDYEKLDLQIETDKIVYDVGETITLSISPSDIPVLIKYGNSSSWEKDIVQLNAVKGEQLIQAKAEGITAHHTIHVKNPVLWQEALNLLLIFGVIYVLYRIISYIWGRIYGMWNP